LVRPREGSDVVSYAPPAIFAKRADFLRLAARGKKFSRPGFVLQVLRTDGGLRVGYTATKKLGNAVLRNRARRRLKEAARLTLAEMAPAGVELVLICRRETAKIPFEVLRATLRATLAEALT
jgi:ribonuclease P protein component